MSSFDYIILNCFASVQPMQDLIKRPCLYVPPGIDAIKFCPYPNPPLRSIDVYSIGRKSQVTHRALLKMVTQNKIFYIYDTMLGMYTARPAEHRSLIANMAKRSRYLPCWRIFWRRIMACGVLKRRPIFSSRRPLLSGDVQVSNNFIK